MSEYESKLVVTPDGQFVWSDEANPTEKWLEGGSRLATEEEIANAKFNKNVINVVASTVVTNTGLPEGLEADGETVIITDKPTVG